MGDGGTLWEVDEDETFGHAQVFIHAPHSLAILGLHAVLISALLLVLPVQLLHARALFLHDGDDLDFLGHEILEAHNLLERVHALRIWSQLFSAPVLVPFPAPAATVHAPRDPSQR